MSWSDLPTLNACLNGLTTLLLLRGWWLIRQGRNDPRRREQHKRTMIAAVACSALFLVSYLVYHSQVGSVKFPGQGAVRTLYLSILLTHTVLAAAVPVLAIWVLVLGLRERFEKHRRLARWAFPIWLYVSITGVVIYVMLYQMSW